MATERAVEEGRLVDDVGARGHRVDGQGGRGSEVLASIGAGAVRRDLDRVPACIAEVRQEAGLVLEPALADDVELRIGSHRALHEPGLGCALELGEVLAGEVRH